MLGVPRFGLIATVAAALVAGLVGAVKTQRSISIGVCAASHKSVESSV